MLDDGLRTLIALHGVGETRSRGILIVDDERPNLTVLRNFLESPAVTKVEKRGAAEKISARLGATKILQNFLFVIIDHRRMHQLPEILQTFQNVLRERQGIAEAEIFSAVSLNQAQKREMKQTLERVTGKKIEAKFSLDLNLLGGTLVRVGDTIYDGSLRNRLNGLRERLLAE